MSFERVEIGDGVYYVGDNLEVMRSLPNDCADVSITSPPYENQRTYGVDFELVGESWVSWMIPRIVEACRVTKGLVFVNAAGPVKEYKYSPAFEWLVADLTRKHGLVCGPSPYCWAKMNALDTSSALEIDVAAGNGVPGSGNRCYHRRDWEPIYGFARPEKLPPAWSDNKAFGTSPRIGSFGGEFSNRGQDGTRANADPWQKDGRGPGIGPRKKDGERVTGYALGHSPGSNRGKNGARKKNKLPTGEDSGQWKGVADKTIKGAHPQDICLVANAGNILRVPVGGSKLGHPLAHETDAPFPLGIPERFIAWYCPPGGTVLDFHMGGGTTAQAAAESQRKWIGIDVRRSQLELTERRLGTVTMGLFS